MLIESVPGWIAVVLLLTAAALGRYAFLGRRVGDTPFCAKCRYNLTGVAMEEPGARCPECGGDPAVRRPARGVRPARLPARRATIVLGSLAGVFLVMNVLSSIWQARLLRAVPDSWLVARVESGAPSAAAAIAELRVRELMGALSQSTIDRLIECELKIHSFERLSRSQWAAVQDLSRRAAANGLSTAQLDRFTRQAFRVRKLTVRPQIAPNSIFTFRAEYELRFGATAVVTDRLAAAFCDDTQLESAPGGDCYWSGPAERFQYEMRYVVGPEKLGRRHIRFLPPIRLPWTMPIPASMSLDLSVPVELVAQPPFETVATLRSDSLDDAVRRGITLLCVWAPADRGAPDGGRDREPVPMIVAQVAESLDADLCLVVIGEIGGEMVRLPYPILVTRGEGACPVHAPWNPASREFDRIYLVASTRAAFERTLFSEIWGGALVFENMPEVLADTPDAHAPGVTGRLEPPWSEDRIASIPVLPIAAGEAREGVGQQQPKPSDN